MDDDPYEVTTKVTEAIASPRLGPETGQQNSAVEASFFERESQELSDTGNRKLAPQISITGFDVRDAVDQLFDNCIEVDSNKRMMKEHVNWFSLTFRLSDMETKVS